MLRNLLGGLLNNDVTAGDCWYYPDLTPETVQGPREDILRRIEQAIENGGSNWELQSTDPDSGTVRAVVETPVFGFRDDVSVRLEPAPGDEPNRWKIIARSRSRVGLGDFGKNARNLRAFYRRLRDPSSKN